MTKLYNFNAIDSWDGDCSERLHGGDVVFRSGFDRTLRYDIYKEKNWDESFFRCLHLCFLPRSSRDNHDPDRMVIRKNIADRLGETGLEKAAAGLRRLVGIRDISPIKREKYMRGDRVTVDVRSFFYNNE